MAEQGFNQAAIDDAFRWYGRFAEHSEMDPDDADLLAADSAIESMREAWGDDFGTRVEAMKTLDSTVPETLELDQACLLWANSSSTIRTS